MHAYSRKRVCSVNNACSCAISPLPTRASARIFYWTPAKKQVQDLKNSSCIVIVDVFVWGKWVEAAAELWSWLHGCYDAGL